MGQTRPDILLSVYCFKAEPNMKTQHSLIMLPEMILENNNYISLLLVAGKTKMLLPSYIILRLGSRLDEGALSSDEGTL